MPCFPPSRTLNWVDAVGHLSSGGQAPRVLSPPLRASRSWRPPANSATASASRRSSWSLSTRRGVTSRYVNISWPFLRGVCRETSSPDDALTNFPPWHWRIEVPGTHACSHYNHFHRWVIMTNNLPRWSLRRDSDLGSLILHPRTSCRCLPRVASLSYSRAQLNSLFYFFFTTYVK